MNQAATVDRPAVMKRLLERIQDEAGMCCPAGTPSDDPAGIGVDDEGDIDEPCLSRDVGEVRRPQHVRRWGVELPVDVIARARRRFIAGGRAHRLAADYPCQAHLAHQPFHGTTGNHEALPHHLPPDLAHAVDGEVLGEHTGYLGFEGRILPRPRG